MNKNPIYLTPKVYSYMIRCSHAMLAGSNLASTTSFDEEAIEYDL